MGNIREEIDIPFGSNDKKFSEEVEQLMIKKNKVRKKIEKN